MEWSEGGRGSGTTHLGTLVKGARRRPVVARPVVAVACLLPRVIVLLISKGGGEEHGMVGYLPCVLNSMTNDIRRLSFGRHVAVGDVAPGFHEVGGRCYPWAVVSFRKWSFASMGGRFRCRRPFVFVSGRCRSFAFVGGRLHSWAVICVLGRSFSLGIVVGDGRSVVVVVGGVVMRWLW